MSAARSPQMQVSTAAVLPAPGPPPPLLAPRVALPAPLSRRARWAALLVALALLLVALALLAGPPLLWTFHIQRAGKLMSVGIRWPTPRLSDSLPARQDDAALDAALDQLGLASYWRPDDPEAYRLTSQVYAARGNWPRAAAQMARARTLAPRNPLFAWETALMYEQMQRAIERAPNEPLMDQLAQAHLVAPGQVVRSLFCRAGGAETCYFGQTEYTLPYADRPKGKRITAPVLFLHPPAHIEQTVQLPAGSAAVEFMIGLDPAVRDWATDGATFRVAVVPTGGVQTQVFALTIDRATAQQGWVRGWADLSRWAGQMVTLVLASDAGPGGDISDDWYGWANVALTSADAKRYALLRPRAQMIEAWKDADLTAEVFEARGDEARKANHPDEALAWYQRATVQRSASK